MTLWVIKQGGDEKVEVYYEHILKLANYFQHQTYDNLLTIFFWTCLQPYFWIAKVEMKWDTLFEHKKDVVICEESMGNANEYRKVL
jgi:hypothetical protein